MRAKLILTAALCFFSLLCNGQFVKITNESNYYGQTYVRYEGDISVGHFFTKEKCGYYSNEHHIQGIVFNTTHGININDYLFTGLGIGFNALIHPKKCDVTWEYYSMPIYATIKGYILPDKRVCPYIKFDIGCNVLIKEIDYSHNHSIIHRDYYWLPQIGVIFKDVQLSMGYRTVKPYYYDGRVNIFSFSLGYRF